MARLRSQRLLPVLQLAQRREETAARQLAQATQRQRDEEQKLQELMRYLDEYAAGWPVGGRLLHVSELQNRSGFMQRLEQAVRQQQGALQQAVQQLEQARQAWRDQYLRRQNLARLIDQAKASEERFAENRQQRTFDDQAGRRIR